jgi:large conductance mechanosensitive channel
MSAKSHFYRRIEQTDRHLEVPVAFYHRTEEVTPVLQDFKKFALRGNVMDLAVGIIIGGAFGRIVSSLVADIIMPAIGAMLGGRNITDMKYVIEPATETAAELAIAYGSFLQSIIDFVIIAFSIFLFIRMFQSMKKKEEEAPTPPPEPAAEELLLTEIRDILKKQ